MCVHFYKKIQYASQHLGITICSEFDPHMLKPTQRIRNLCFENVCRQFNNHYMCPPYSGSINEIRERLAHYTKGILFQYVKPLDVRNDSVGLKNTKIDFHEKILQLENTIKLEGACHVWGMIGGNCELCEPCKAASKEPCTYPQKARTSLESISIDVLSFLQQLGLDNAFHPHKITWTGCIIYSLHDNF